MDRIRYIKYIAPPLLGAAIIAIIYYATKSRDPAEAKQHRHKHKRKAKSKSKKRSADSKKNSVSEDTHERDTKSKPSTSESSAIKASEVAEKDAATKTAKAAPSTKTSTATEQNDSTKTAKAAPSTKKTSAPSAAAATKQDAPKRRLPDLRMSAIEKEALSSGLNEDMEEFTALRYNEWVMAIDLATKLASELDVDLNDIEPLRKLCKDIAGELPSKKIVKKALSAMKQDANSNPAQMAVLHAILAEAPAPGEMPGQVDLSSDGLIEAHEYWKSLPLSSKHPIIEAWFLYKLALRQEDEQKAIDMLNNAKSVITSVLGGHAIQLTAIDHAIAEFTQNSDTRKAVKMLFDVAAARAKYIPSDDTAVVAFKQLLNSVFLDVIDLGYKLKDMSVVEDAIEMAIERAIGTIGPKQAIQAVGPTGLGQELIQSPFTCGAYIMLYNSLQQYEKAKKLEIDSVDQWTMLVDTISAHIVLKDYEKALSAAALAKKLADKTPDDEEKRTRILHSAVNEAITIIQAGVDDRLEEAVRPLQSFLTMSPASIADEKLSALALLHLLDAYAKLNESNAVDKIRSMLAPPVVEMYEQVGLRKAWLLLVFGESGLLVDEMDQAGGDSLEGDELTEEDGQQIEDGQPIEEVLAVDSNEPQIDPVD